ncbi:hypothetical protein CCUG60885_01076 [Mycobacteroides salmoniphilum]|uniref:Uncharacterized protein n=1 Tax=Mycobacteroides salmoniphilum TaxID=404941 RepID=A0A4R8SK16_9MYCO|nr:hypothetical protein CCUG60885_01076 [Mycobacteroides salmoniphilum]TEA01757.1 hypothetical protein CCUG60883_04296 [Mycobacteroides salmoniphilum]
MSPTKQLILNTDQNAYLAPIQGWKQSVQKLESRTETFKVMSTSQVAPIGRGSSPRPLSRTLAMA